MNRTAAEYALEILEALPALLPAGQGVLDMISGGTATLKAMIADNRKPTEDEWQALNDQTEALRQQLHSA